VYNRLERLLTEWTLWLNLEWVLEIKSLVSFSFPRLISAYLAPLAETFEAKLMHARVREAFASAAGQADGTIGRR